ncbi:PAS domain-containing protein [Lacinutrix iliipiscaria]|uniref:PAS domain-containing protein n=1 Tax=Lacinutrix iliipiscaria TaxID=1230532 RepID=A0ABW5WTQ2_9FLAO
MEAIKYYLSANINESVVDLLKGNTIFTITDTLGRIEYASDNYCELIESNANEVIGETQKLLKSHLYSDEVYKSLWRTIKMGYKWNGVLSETLKSGRTLCLDTTIVPVKNELDKSIRYIAIYHDVTKLHLENNQLLNTVKADKGFLNSMPFHMFLINKHGKILNVNKSHHGIEVSELIGTYIYIQMSSNSIETYRKNIEQVFFEKTPRQFEINEVNSKGKMSFYSVIISPVFNDLGIISSATVMIQEIFKNDTIKIDSQDAKVESQLIRQKINYEIQL